MIPSLHALEVRPGHLFRRETHGTSQRHLIEIEKKKADMDLKQAIRKLIDFDQTLAENASNRVRDESYSRFNITFVPYETEIIFDYNTPTERRERHPALRIILNINPSQAMTTYLKTASHAMTRNGIGALCTTVMSHSYSCLGIFNTKWLPLMLWKEDGDVSIDDSVNQLSNDQWPNVLDLYNYVYNSVDHPVNDPRLPVLAGMSATYTTVPDPLIGSDRLLTGFTYTFGA